MNGPIDERLRNGQVHSAIIFAGDATRSPTPPSVILVAQALLAVCSRSVFRGWCRKREVVILCMYVCCVTAKVWTGATIIYPALIQISIHTTLRESRRAVVQLYGTHMPDKHAPSSRRVTRHAPPTPSRQQQSAVVRPAFGPGAAFGRVSRPRAPPL